jgi:DNA-binding NarL/FixJ family response regulator
MHDGDLPGSVDTMALRCVLVDDNADFVTAARSLLEHEGMTVLGAAGNGAEALRLAAVLRPDILLVDIDLGPESGLELARRLSRSGRPVPPPVILISSYAEEDYADLIADSPALGFLSKSELSAAAIRRLLDDRTDVPSGPTKEPTER